MKTVISHYEDINRKTAGQIRELLTRKRNAVIALSTGKAVKGLYGELAAMADRGEISFRDASFFTVGELAGTDFCRRTVSEYFLDRTDAKAENCFFVSEENAAEYDGLITARGGLDLAILTLGGNARIGFNEPATPFDSLTHSQILAPATRRELADTFGSEENVPERGVTMGIKTLTLARDIMVLAFGGEQAESVFKMLYGRNDSTVPAAFLQIPQNVTVYLDGEAAKKL